MSAKSLAAAADDAVRLATRPCRACSAPVFFGRYEASGGAVHRVCLDALPSRNPNVRRFAIVTFNEGADPQRFTLADADEAEPGDPLFTQHRCKSGKEHA